MTIDPAIGEILNNQSAVKELTQFKAALDEHAIVAITDKLGKITYVNDKFCAISKYERAELLGNNHRIINSGYHSKEFMRNLWQTIRNGKVWQGDIRNRAKDGSIYWVNTTIVPFLDNDGTPFQYIAIRAEITERKLLEEKNAGILKELTDANQELADFAYIVSHDLKAPLRGINSLANWLVEDYSDKLGTEGKQLLDLMIGRTRRLGKLVDGILAYSRAGRNPASSETIDLNLIVHDTIDLLTPPPHITVEITNPLPQVTLEYYKAQQIFQNLISNAIKFMDKPIGRITITAAKECSDWHFTVADNGPGIDSRYFKKIFELFETLNNCNEAESTGVGLSLVKRIVESHGGAIWVESTVNIGTAFHFTLPFIQQSPEKPLQYKNKKEQL
jgi:PAS domain S-box-containing protein